MHGCSQVIHQVSINPHLTVSCMVVNILWATYLRHCRAQAKLTVYIRSDLSGSTGAGSGRIMLKWNWIVQTFVKTNCSLQPSTVTAVIQNIVINPMASRKTNFKCDFEHVEKKERVWQML